MGGDEQRIMTDDRTQVAAAKADRGMESCTLVLFGASGDLTQRMVMPAIFRLARRGLLPPDFRVIGYARSEMTDDEFRAQMRKVVMRDECGRRRGGVDTGFAARLCYIPAEYDGDDGKGYAELRVGSSV